jgi:hypothetical protein
MKIFLVILLSIISNFVFGQFAIVKDKDRTCNVRHKADITSKVINKLENGHFVYIMETNGEWVNVDYSINGNTLSGYIYKNRVKLISDFVKIPIQTKDDNIIIHSEDSIKIVVEFQYFEKKQHILTYKEGYIEKIDNKKYWGTDGGMPKREYKSISITIKGEKLSLPKVAIENLYEPNNENLRINLDKQNNTIYIQALNSDGAGGYFVIWKIKDGEYKEKYVVHGF